MSFGPHLFLALLEGTVTAFVLAVTALGLSLVFGVMRIVNVAHGGFFMLGAVLASLFAGLGGSALGAVPSSLCVGLVGSPLGGFLFALVAAPLAVGAIALATDWLVLRRLDYH